MELKNNKSFKYIDNGIVMISKDGIKWLTEKYFRKAYLKDLEIRKLNDLTINILSQLDGY